MTPPAYVRRMGLDFAIVTGQPAPVGPQRAVPPPLHAAPETSVTGWPVGPHWGDVVAEWSCPVCGVRCDRTFRSGRARVYCTNACRQRAYRWRRDRTLEGGRRPASARPAVRARTRERLHALRSPGDLLAARRDSTGRQVTACGTFGRSASDHPDITWHTEFVAGGPRSCRTCANVLGIEPVPVATMLERALAHRSARRRVH